MEKLNNRTLVQLQPNAAAIPAPLRFYDPELQNALNVEPFDAERLERARAKARQLNAAYLRGLTALESRLSKRTFSLFKDPRDPMFDGDLIEFSFGDSLTHPVTGNRRRALEMSVQATFRSFDEKTLHMLTYKGIKSLNVNVPSERWFDQWRSRIDCLLAHELTDEEKGYMQHAFLFVSGAAVSITFERVSWQTKRNGSR